MDFSSTGFFFSVLSVLLAEQTAQLAQHIVEAQLVCHVADIIDGQLGLDAFYDGFQLFVGQIHVQQLFHYFDGILLEAFQQVVVALQLVNRLFNQFLDFLHGVFSLFM